MKKTFGKRVKAARKFRNITQEELCNAIGIKQSALSYIETGRNNTDIETENKIAKTLSVSLDWLNGLTDESDVPLPEYTTDGNYDEILAVSERFQQVYVRLKSLGAFKNDAEFADASGIPRGSLSLALSGKTKINLEWVSELEKFGANKEFIYNNKPPMIKASIQTPEQINKQYIVNVIYNMRHELDALEEYVLSLNH